ncbi:RNA polymerase sigma factor [Xylanimonas ulmi]|uniref:RNA polymerase sigma-70 factor (ECF subfamily) n=1 Tax=Xylanimonas ulmi TaxID=228973 RepID=A0A4V2EY91_9MICO|nr:sigma-70 family RNA polymerase sigma factor [Xylanibacterium ulmi]RZS62170.1 RNA polymerase sigma-70 factor (ECF subfamily) [Xylanibacterium ulmi]
MDRSREADGRNDDATTAGRDAAWFDALFAAHATALHRYFVRRLPDGGTHADAAEDLAAEVLATAWRRRDDVPRGAELAWLYRTAGFVLANHRRKARAVPLAAVPEALDDVDPSQLALDDERVRRVLGRLSARDRQILLLVAWDGLRGDDLADVLGLSRGGADAALSRARARLGVAWDETDADDAPGPRAARGR